MFKKILTAVLALILVFSLAACGQTSEGASGNSSGRRDSQAASSSAANEQTPSSEKESTSAAEAESTPARSGTSSSGESVVITADVTSDGAIDASDIFSERDLTQTADLSEAAAYTVKSGENITISAAGVYVISGTAQESSVIVDASGDDKVQIVLDGVSVENSSTPCIYVKSADKVFITTSEGSVNTLTVSGEFAADGDTNTDAVIFSKDDLVLNGLGTLNISSSDNGITSKDDLKITGGEISIACASDAIEANDSIRIADGKITIRSEEDGLHSENDDDDTLGWIYICGGTFDINVSDDAVHGESVVQIDAGTFDITAAEGIEGTYLQINGGTIAVSASDDGINAAQKSNSYTPTIEIRGGEISVTMGPGDTDALDSNGNLLISGGTLNISAQSPFDYDGQGTLSGGTVYVNGQQITQLSNQMMGGFGQQPGGFGQQPGGFGQQPGGPGGQHRM